MEINAGVDIERKERAPQEGLMKPQISHLGSLSRSNTHLESPSSNTATVLAMSLKQKHTLK